MTNDEYGHSGHDEFLKQTGISLFSFFKLRRLPPARFVGPKTVDLTKTVLTPKTAYIYDMPEDVFISVYGSPLYVLNQIKGRISPRYIGEYYVYFIMVTMLNDNEIFNERIRNYYGYEIRICRIDLKKSHKEWLRMEEEA
jgi:hypothetical protein